MPVNIIVCVKQVPHPEHFSRITFDPARQAIRREGIPTVINPLDLNAVEEALRLRDRFTGKVTVISMGPPGARAVLEGALAMGADAAVLLSDKSFAGADSLATAYCLSCGIKKIPFDLVLCGKESIDSGTGQVAPQVAEFLGIPHATSVSEITVGGEDTLILKQVLERGYMKVRVRMPAVLAVTGEINQPRLPTIMTIMGAKEKPLEVWGASRIEADPDRLGLSGSPTQVTGMRQREIKRRREVLRGGPEEIAREAVERLQELLKA